MPDPHEPLFEPDPTFAAEWFVDDALAQGAFKHACIMILDQFADAVADSATPSPDLGDFGPLGMFPSGFRPALTQLLVEKMQVAATVVGWKLAQPGPAIPPSCVGEELALELIRREAISALEAVEAPKSSIDATRGVFEVCQDADILNLFDMQEPADAAVSLTDPANISLGKADMRPEEWFKPFYGGVQPGMAPHPLYLESEMPPPNAGDL